MHYSLFCTALCDILSGDEHLRRPVYIALHFLTYFLSVCQIQVKYKSLPLYKSLHRYVSTSTSNTPVIQSAHFRSCLDFKEEWEAYSEAANPILALNALNDEMDKAAKTVARMAGMRAVEGLWEEQQDPQAAEPPQRTHQQQRPAQQQRTPQQPASKGPWQQTQQGQQQTSSWAQRGAAAAALPQRDFKRISRNGKVERDPTGLEPTKQSLPWDGHAILFERVTGTPQIGPGTAARAAAEVNIALSKVAPPHIRTEAFKISVQGRLTTTARVGASAAMLLHFKKEIIEAARRADKAIINVVANETWAELKILVPYPQY